MSKRLLVEIVVTSGGGFEEAQPDNASATDRALIAPG